MKRIIICILTIVFTIGPIQAANLTPDQVKAFRIRSKIYQALANVSSTPVTPKQVFDSLIKGLANAGNSAISEGSKTLTPDRKKLLEKAFKAKGGAQKYFAEMFKNRESFAKIVHRHVEALIKSGAITGAEEVTEQVAKRSLWAKGAAATGGFNALLWVIVEAYLIEKVASVSFAAGKQFSESIINAYLEQMNKLATAAEQSAYSDLMSILLRKTREGGNVELCDNMDYAEAATRLRINMHTSPTQPYWRIICRKESTSASTQETEPQRACSPEEVAGTYKAGWGPIKCEQGGAGLDCCYGASCKWNLRLAISSDGQKLEGIWDHNDGRTGPVEFGLNDNCELSSGRYGYKAGELTGGWQVTGRSATGKSQEALTEPKKCEEFCVEWICRITGSGCSKFGNSCDGDTRPDNICGKGCKQAC